MRDFPRKASVALLISGLTALTAVGLVLARVEWLGYVAAGVALASAWVAVAVIHRGHRADRQRLAQLAELDTRRADQASVLSHEIRTPLAVIQGAAELLAEESAGPLTARQAVFVDRIIGNAVRMHTFSEQLLMRARLEAGLVSIERRTVDLRTLFRAVVEELSQISEATIVLDAPGAPVSAVVDPQLIRQVVTNLVNNAASSESASGRVEVRIVPGDGEVMISVSDGGTGMTDAQRERLFRRFSSGRPLGNGTGIGLFISQQFVELHGGRIYVDTITGKGTTMMFTLPLAEPPLPRGRR
ncbi:HAMP domain-containing histidine kinase [Agromyces atrinae]|uniref:sensor histidine kinase n=1 Tax=Agromyces atrinae TaxID=592376 RepID=UPI001F59B8F0|nr:HAMP domain-containing sensor histidine kinase [Agromyces atrinae]MCI2957204.1 HAMP domain-containing histidine kinase [Agromyces atrinae]